MVVHAYTHKMIKNKRVYPFAPPSLSDNNGDDNIGDDDDDDHNNDSDNNNDIQCKQFEMSTPPPVFIFIVGVCIGALISNSLDIPPSA